MRELLVARLLPGDPAREFWPGHRRCRNGKHWRTKLSYAPEPSFARKVRAATVDLSVTREDEAAESAPLPPACQHHSL